MFRNAEIGDKIWSFKYNKYVIISDIVPNDEYPIVVHLDDNGIHAEYITYDGKFDITDANPSYFWKSFDIPKEATTQSIKQNSLVKVWDGTSPTPAIHRYATGTFNSNGLIEVYTCGADSITTDGDTTVYENFEVIKI